MFPGKEAKWGLVISTAFLVSMFLIVYLVASGEKTTPKCYEEPAILIKQYLCNATGKGGKCVNCLCLKMQSLLDGDVHTYYFADEHSFRKDFYMLEGKKVVIRWCPTEFGYRIRGVYYLGE